MRGRSHRRHQAPCPADPSLADLDLACRIRRLRRSRRRVVGYAGKHGPHRHDRRALPVLQYRNGRGDRGEFWKPYGPERGVQAAPPPKFEAVPISAADQSDQCPSARTRLGIGASLSARQRHLGKHHLFRKFGQRALGATDGIRRHSNPPAMARRDRLRARGRCADRDLVRGGRRQPQLGRASGRPIKRAACSTSRARREAVSPLPNL